MNSHIDPVEQEPVNYAEVVDIVDEEELDDIAGGDGGQPSYPPYL